MNGGLKCVFCTLCAVAVSVLLLFSEHVIHNHLLDINGPQPLLRVSCLVGDETKPPHDSDDDSEF